MVPNLVGAGFTWTNLPTVNPCGGNGLPMNHPAPLSTLSPDQLMARGMEYRRMGLTATTVEARESLFLLALRFVDLATLRKVEERRAGRLLFTLPNN
jgi:hypothetical protein